MIGVDFVHQQSLEAFMLSSSFCDGKFVPTHTWISSPELLLSMPPSHLSCASTSISHELGLQLRPVRDSVISKRIFTRAVEDGLLSNPHAPHACLRFSSHALGFGC